MAEKTIEVTLDALINARPERDLNNSIQQIIHWMMQDQQEKGPPNVIEETVTVTDDVGRLQFNAAYVWMVSGGNVVYSLVDKATTPGSGEVAADLTPGDGGKTKLTFANADSVTSVKVNYITEFCQDFFDNLVESDLVDATAATGHASISGEVITITGGAAAIMSVDVDGTPKKPVYSGDTQAAGEYALNFDDSGDTTLTGAGTEFSAATSIYITFIKKPSAGALVDNFVDEETTAVGGDDVVNALYPIFCLATAGFVVTSDKAPAPLLNAGGTLQAGQAQLKATTLQYWDPTPDFTFHADLDPTNGKLSYLRGLPSEYRLRTPPRVESNLAL